MKLIEKLRESTSVQHSKLDQIQEMKRLTSESVTENDYKEYLQAFLKIYTNIEADIYNYSSQYLKEIESNQRLPLIEKDLRNFNVYNPAPQGSIQFNLKGKEYLGALYVMEGSRLGGNLIGKHLTNHLNFEKTDLKFLISRPSVKWPQIISFLNEQPEENHVEIIKGAQKVFQFFYDQLSEFYNSIE
jgi:heme oxygenase